MRDMVGTIARMDGEKYMHIAVKQSVGIPEL
jgi:hypothetical protein